MRVTKLKKLHLLLVVGLIVPILAVGGVTLAHAQDETTEDTTSETTAEQKREALQERLETRKTALELKLTLVQQARLKARCKSAQGLLKAAEVRINGVETRRMTAYEKLIDRLGELSTSLNSQGIDTTELETELVELQAKIDAFKEQIAEYKQAVSDIAAMDCTADPDAFKASLEAARTARAEAVTAAKEIHDYLLDTIKETLKDIRAQLNEDNEGGEDSSGE